MSYDTSKNFPCAFTALEGYIELSYDLDHIISNMAKCAYDVQLRNGGSDVLQKSIFVQTATKGYLARDDSANKWRNFIKSLKVFSCIDPADLESELRELSHLIRTNDVDLRGPNASPSKTYEELALEDNKMYCVLELKSCLSYIVKFSLTTFQKQRQQLLSLSAGLRYLAYELSPLDYVSSCLTQLENVQVETIIKQMARHLLSTSVNTCFESTHPVLGRFLTESQISLCLAYLLPAPQFTHV